MQAETRGRYAKMLQGRMIRRPLLCALALALAALSASVVLAAVASDPDWRGATPARISSGSDDKSWQPSIAADTSGELVAAWSDEKRLDNIRDIYVASYAGGAWSSPQVISTTTNNSSFPEVLAVGDRYFVVWIEIQTDHAYETEVGTGSMRKITSIGMVQSKPSLAVGGGRLHVAFSASQVGRQDIHYASRWLTATTWPVASVVYESKTLGSWWPELVITPDGQTLHLVWEELTTLVGSSSVMYMRGTRSGDSVIWSTPIVISAVTRAIRPDMALESNGDLHLVWGEVTSIGYDEQYVRYARYEAASSTWITPSVRIDAEHIEANEEAPTYVAPRLVLREEGGQTKVCVVWHGFRAGADAEEVLIRCSHDGGDTWTEDTQNVSRTKGSSEISVRPALTYDAIGLLHVVWQESYGTNLASDYEIYHTQSLGNIIYLPLVYR